jgi:hypothetical protein
MEFQSEKNSVSPSLWARDCLFQTELRGEIMPESQKYSADATDGRASTRLSSDAERLLAALAVVRESVAVAWRERGVTLTAEERKRLRAEIDDTCEFLTALTSAGD